MNSEYLIKEYELCFEQLRFYDTRQEELLKYLATLTSAVATAQFAILKAFGTSTTEFFGAQAFLSLVVFVASVLLFLMMLQNRLYFVFIARQLNAIRGHMLKTVATDFLNNQLYTSTGFSAFKWSSVHSMQLLGASLISSLFAAASTFGLLNVLGLSGGYSGPALVFLAIWAAEVIGGAAYLKDASKKTADEAIHPERGPTKPEPCAPPNGGPATPSGNSGAQVGPPSVS